MKKHYFIASVMTAVLLLSFTAVNASKREADVRPVDKATSQQVTETNKDGLVADPKLPPPATSTQSPEAGEQINWQVISGGGGKGTSTNYILNFTVGQTAVGLGQSTSYDLYHGYWQAFMLGEPSCCVGRTGDADGIGGLPPNDAPTVSDIGVIINQLFGDGTVVSCLDEADADTSAFTHPPVIPDDITVSDIGWIIDELFGSGKLLPDCP